MERVETMGWLEDLLNRFYCTPTSYTFYSLDEIIRYGCTNFLFSGLAAWLGFLLTWTILSHRYSTACDHYIYRISFAFGLLGAVTVHFILDGFTTIA